MYFPKPKPITPKPGQESVWDYPRPAILQDTDKHLKVICQGVVLAQTSRGKRVLETSHPPTYYFPAEDVKLEYLRETAKQLTCEWKGRYQYYDVCIGDKCINYAAWLYIQPTANFTSLKNHYAFMPSLMDACYVNDELAIPQPGNFYGGWITSDIVGPFKGEEGTWGW
jgi:uncharacterized protein (DUF427 family)